ncbi:MAG: hypothetical protein ACM3XM_16550 [Mycobacterium leprae]
MSYAPRALICAAWTERWNRQWRFSRVRSGLWVLLLQIGMAGALLWRVHGEGFTTGTSFSLWVMLTQAGIWAFLSVFLNSTRLYGGRSQALLHLSPAPAWSLVVAQVGGDLPRRCWSMLLWALSLSAILPGEQRGWVVPLLWIAGVAIGSFGQFAGIFCVILLVRKAPQAYEGSRILVLLLQLVLFYVGIFLVARTGSLAQVAAGLTVVRRGWFAAGTALLLGVPGLLLLLQLMRHPGQVGEAYRDGWLRLMEMGERGARRRHSTWPAPSRGAAGAIVAREWLQMGRNGITLFRVVAMSLLLGSSFFMRGWLASLAEGRRELVILGIGVGLIWAAYGEMAAALFTSDAAGIGLYLVTGVRASRLMLGKLVALAPYVLLSVLSTLAVALAAGAGGWGGMALAVHGGAVGLGMVLIMIGLGALDLKEQEPGDAPEAREVSAALEQVPMGAWSVGGFLLGVAFGGVAVMQAGGLLAGLAAGLGLWSVPVAAAGLGYGWLRHVLAHGMGA